MTQDEKDVINRSIQSYKNMINFFKDQIMILERKKLNISERCPECIPLKISTKSRGK